MSMLTKPSFETTLQVRDSCLCLHVQRAARALARRFDDVLRPLGLTNGQFSLMMSLNRPEPPGMAAVASVLAMDRTTQLGIPEVRRVDSGGPPSFHDTYETVRTFDCGFVTVLSEHHNSGIACDGFRSRAPRQCDLGIPIHQVLL